MKWLKTIAYGAGGFLLAGPVGAVIGAGVSSLFYDAQDLTPEEQLQLQFFISIFCLSAKIAMSDGVVSNEEVQTIDCLIKELELGEEARQAAIQTFKEAQDSTRSFEDFALDFYTVFEDNRKQLLSMMELLFQVAAADKTYHPNEEKMLLKAVEIFKLRQLDYDRIKSIHFDDTDKYYALLECNKEDSDETIKSNYRRLVKTYHPDNITSLISQGLPQEFIMFAESKFQDIQKAYEKIKREREWKRGTSFIQKDNQDVVSSHHFVNGICKKCGCSEKAVNHFKWPCKKTIIVHNELEEGE